MINKKIDIRNIINTSHQFGKSMQGTLSINGNDRIFCTIKSGSVHMMFTHQVSGLLKYAKQVISLERESQNHSNKDTHFVCPCCERKTFVLYHRKKSFRCRKCSALTRQSLCHHMSFFLSTHNNCVELFIETFKLGRGAKYAPTITIYGNIYEYF